MNAAPAPERYRYVGYVHEAPTAFTHRADKAPQWASVALRLTVVAGPGLTERTRRRPAFLTVQAHAERSPALYALILSLTPGEPVRAACDCNTWGFVRVPGIPGAAEAWKRRPFRASCHYLAGRVFLEAPRRSARAGSDPPGTDRNAGLVVAGLVVPRPEWQGEDGQ